LKNLIFILTLYYLPLNAQIFGEKSIAISHSFMQFNEPFLANKTNANNKTSWVSEIEKINNISRFFSYSYGLGLGVYNNLDTRFDAYKKSNFIRLKGNLICHLPKTECSNCSGIRLINPYAKIGYLADKLDNSFKDKSGSYFNSSMNFGGGLVFKITDFVGLNYDFTINQRINNDYRTFSQHKIGVVINLNSSKTDSK